MVMVTIMAGPQAYVLIVCASGIGYLSKVQVKTFNFLKVTGFG